MARTEAWAEFDEKVPAALGQHHQGWVKRQVLLGTIGPDGVLMPAHVLPAARTIEPILYTRRWVRQVP